MPKRDRPRVKAERPRLLLTLRLNPAKMRLLTGFVDTYLRLTSEAQKQFRETLVTIAPESEEIIMPLMTNAEERGWQRGLAEGIRALPLSLFAALRCFDRQRAR
jgi:hypothetical protein